MINTLIATVLIIGLITRPDKARPVLIFIGPAFVFQINVLFSAIPADYFHMTAALLDLAVIVMLVWWSKPGFAPVFLGLISLLSVFANAFGWMAYENGYSAVVYDGIYQAVYALVLVISLMEWSSGARADCYDMRIRSGWI
jgi:hypothetical protein